MSAKTPGGITAEGLRLIRESGPIYCYVDRTRRGDHIVGVGFVPRRSWSQVKNFSLYYPLGSAALRRLKTYRKTISEAEFYALLSEEQSRLNVD